MVLLYDLPADPVIETIKALLSILINLISKCALVYRCKMLWGANPVLGIPIVLTILHFGMSVVYVIATYIGSTDYFPSWVLLNGQTGSLVAYAADISVYLLLIIKCREVRRKREAADPTAVHAPSLIERFFLCADTTQFIITAYPCAKVAFEEGTNFVPNSAQGLITISYGIATTMIFSRVSEDITLFSKVQRDLEKQVKSDVTENEK